MAKEKTTMSARERFYKNKKTFCSFEGFTDDIVNYFSEMARNFKKNYLSTKQDPNHLKRTDYINTLNYLTSEKWNDLNFDEKILFFILIVDPDLIIYKIFCETSLISKEQIDKEKNKHVRAILTSKRIQQLTDIEIRITKQLGFCDKRLLYYEEVCLNKIFCKHTINTLILKNRFPKLAEYCKYITNIEMITDIRYKEIEKIAKNFIGKINTSPTVAIVSNALIYQGEQLKLYTLNEYFIFFILTIDPNFYLLTILDEESCTENIKKRALQELGFYDENLVELEKMLVKRFCEEKWKETRNFSYANKKQEKSNFD